MHKMQLYRASVLACLCGWKPRPRALHPGQRVEGPAAARIVREQAALDQGGDALPHGLEVLRYGAAELCRGLRHDSTACAKDDPQRECVDERSHMLRVRVRAERAKHRKHTRFGALHVEEAAEPLALLAAEGDGHLVRVKVRVRVRVRVRHISSQRGLIDAWWPSAPWPSSRAALAKARATTPPPAARGATDTP